MTESTGVLNLEYVLLVLVFHKIADVETHCIVTSLSPREVAAAHMQRCEVERVIILDDDRTHDPEYLVIFDTRTDL